MLNTLVMSYSCKFLLPLNRGRVCCLDARAVSISLAKVYEICGAVAVRLKVLAGEAMGKQEKGLPHS